MLAFLDLVILAFVLFLVVGFITQVVMPLFRGTPLFPQFRPTTALKQKVNAEEKELYETTEEVRLHESLKEINRRKAELEGK